MAETKPFASLSSGLLARKGAAKPAMRPQGFGSFGSNLEDLGWDDMGGAHAAEEHVPTPIHALTPSPGGRKAEPTEAAPEAMEEPFVIEQQRALQASFPEPKFERQSDPATELETRPGPAAVVELAPRRAAPARAPASGPVKAKAAFTLRLDPARHLKLRLACALGRRSAQQLVTEALDNFLNTLPELDALADHVPAEAGQGNR